MSRADIAPRTARRLTGVLPRLLLALAAGCSVIPEPEPAPRVYSVPLADGPARGSGAPVAHVRLRSITPAAYLDENVAWREGLQVGVTTGVRWADRPDVVLQRALLEQLFSDGRLVRSEALDAPVLDVDLLAFEELLDGDSSVAHVELHARLLDAARNEMVALDLESRQPLEAGDDRTAALARALGTGVDDVCTRLAAEIVRAFGR